MISGTCYPTDSAQITPGLREILSHLLQLHRQQLPPLRHLDHPQLFHLQKCKRKISISINVLCTFLCFSLQAYLSLPMDTQSLHPHQVTGDYLSVC